MNYVSILNAMSGPINSLLRYGVTALGALVVSKGWLDDAGWTTVGGAILTVVPAIIGALTATKTAKVASVAALPDVASVVKTNGTVVRGE